MPVTVESGVLNPDTSAFARLQWVELAIKIYQESIDRPTTDIDSRQKIAEVLKTVVPALESIRDEHPSESLRNRAARSLQFISDNVRA